MARRTKKAVSLRVDKVTRMKQEFSLQSLPLENMKQ